MRSSFKPTAYMYVIFAISFYRDIKQLSHKGGGEGGGGVSGPPGPPPSYAPDVEKNILPSLVYVLNKT